MGAPCSCSRLSRKTVMEHIEVIQCQSFSYIQPYSSELDSTEVRQGLLKYLAVHGKELSTKINVLFQHAINFPEDALSEFVLENWQPRETDWPHFLRLLYTGRHASRLRLANIPLSPTAYETICRGVTVLKRLQILELTYLNIGYFSAERIITAISGLINLEALNLKGNYLGVVFIEHLFQALPKPSTLTTCNLDDNNITDEAATTITHHLPHFPLLKQLSLALNPLTSKGISALRAGKSALLDLHCSAVSF